MATTTAFGWETPDDTDLVKDGAAAIRTLGNSIDTSLAELKGGTTGQVLSKTSATDMDFTWVAQDDSNAIQNAIVDAKGDIIAATGADTPARLEVGANDTVLTADSSTATGLKWGSVATGGMTLLSTTTLSGTSTAISSINQTYNRLYVVVNGAYTNTADQLQVTTNAGQPQTINIRNATVTGSSGFLSGGNLPTAANTGTFVIQIENYSNSGGKVFLFDGGGTANAAGVIHSTGLLATATTVSTITFLTFSGTATFSGGTVRIYGVK